MQVDRMNLNHVEQAVITKWYLQHNMESEKEDKMIEEDRKGVLDKAERVRITWGDQREETHLSTHQGSRIGKI